jgi:ATP-dependent DNA ligase
MDVQPMLAKASPTVPGPDDKGGPFAYEPKWDGFRAIVSYDGENVEIGSRGAKPLTRYFPELVAVLKEQLPGPCVVDGEVVVRSGKPGAEKLDWESLSQRIHPAESRITKLSQETPASFIAFDLIEVDNESLLDVPFVQRRERLEQFLKGIKPPLHFTQVTQDVELARRWLVEFEGAGLDGVVSKPLAAPYSPGKRTMIKTKHHRTADVVLMAYRIHKSGQGVGSLLVGLYGEDGTLIGIGGVSAFTDKKRLELIDELAPLVVRDAEGNAVKGDKERNRFAAADRDTSFVELRPERVLEIRYDQMEGWRLRHAGIFERWRPDRDPKSCTYEQLEVPAAYDFGELVK